jgi:hypothetical protein
MNYVDGLVHVFDENNLQESTTAPLAPDQMATGAKIPGIGPSGFPNDLLGLFRPDAVPGHVFKIPVVPSEPAHVPSN